jgi:mannose-1-phosphate guanylyltransferase
MKAVILVGGEGTRLRPLTYDVPKPMVPIVNKPYMEHQVEYLMRHGFKDIVFALGYKSEAFARHFGDGSRWGARFWFEVEDEPLGTAGAVKNVEHLLDDTFLVFNGDVLCDIDLTSMLSFHRQQGAVGTLALTPVDDPSQYGVVETDAEHRIEAFVEKPPRDQAKSNAINAGVYILEPKVLSYMFERGRKCMFEHHVFPSLLKASEPLFALVSQGYWLDIGRPSSYLKANHDTLTGELSLALPADSNGQWIDPTATVDGAAIAGPVWIGAHATVAPGARVVGPTVIGAGCRIAEGAVIEGSILWNDTKVGRGARLERCMVGRASNIGEGARLDAEAVLGSEQTVPPGGHLAAGEKAPVAAPH